VFSRDHSDTNQLLQRVLDSQSKLADHLNRYESATQSRLEIMARELQILTEIVKPNNQEEGSLGYQVKVHHNRLIAIETDIKEIRTILSAPTWLQMSANKAVNVAIQAVVLGAVGFAGLSIWTTVVQRLDQELDRDPGIRRGESLDPGLG
jgi:hypothetical protein